MQSQGRSVTWLAGKLHCDRTNIYKLYDRSTVDTELLMKISIILDYNFFALFSDEWLSRRQQR